MLTIIDYSMGNLHSVGNALDRLGVPYRISASPEALESADGLILPGVPSVSRSARRICVSEVLRSTSDCLTVGIGFTFLSLFFYFAK